MTDPISRFNAGLGDGLVGGRADSDRDYIVPKPAAPASPTPTPSQHVLSGSYGADHTDTAHVAPDNTNASAPENNLDYDAPVA